MLSDSSPPAPLEHAAATLQHAVREAFESGQIQVPPLPWAAARLLSTGALPPLPWLVNALASDEAVACAMLRIANSPSYQPRCPIMSVDQAATRLGPQAIGEMALAVSLQVNLFCPDGFEDELRAFWRHALAAAVFARDLSRACGVSALEGFACGLLRDIGRPLALTEAANRCVEVGLAPCHPQTHAAVVATATSLAPAAAAYVATAWKLPAPLASAMVRHAPTFRVTDSPHATVAHMATQMAGSLYRCESPWDLARKHAVAVNDATAAGLPDLGNAVRTWVESLTV